MQFTDGEAIASVVCDSLCGLLGRGQVVVLHGSSRRWSPAKQIRFVHPSFGSQEFVAVFTKDHVLSCWLHNGQILIIRGPVKFTVADL